jgi:hypothetical protein
MTKKSILQNIFGGLIYVCLSAGAVFAQQMPTFTYQGKLTNNGTPATGSYEMRFRLFNQVENGFQFGTPKIISNVAVANGIFTVKLEVGDWTFDQNDRFMEIAVRPQGNSNPFTVLAPLQQITLAPKAIFSDAAAIADFSSSSAYAVNSLKLNGLDANRYVQTDSATFVRNQTTPQAATNFNISGNGIIGGNLGIGTTTPQAKLHVAGNAVQDRDKGGMVKAMLSVSSNGTLERCYNGISGVSTGNCGFTVNRFTGGSYEVNFGFQVSDRFISVTAKPVAPPVFGAASENASANFAFAGNNTLVYIYTFLSAGSSQNKTDAGFMLIVY